MNFKFDTIRNILEATSDSVFKTECETKIVSFEMIDDTKCLVGTVANNVPFKAFFDSNDEEVSLTYHNMENDDIYEFMVERTDSEVLEDLCVISGENGIIAIGKEKRTHGLEFGLMNNRSILYSSVNFHSFSKKKKNTNNKQKINI